MSETPKYFCKTCETSEEVKFSKKVFDICKECKKLANPKPYICKHCGDNIIENFTIGRHTSCKKCTRYKANQSACIKQNLIANENKFEDKEITSQIEKYLLTNYKLFRGETTKMVIDNHTEKIQGLENNFIKVEEKFNKNENYMVLLYTKFIKECKIESENMLKIKEEIKQEKRDILKIKEEIELMLKNSSLNHLEK